MRDEKRSQRLLELYGQIQNHDDANVAVEARFLLEKEATEEWLPTLNEWFSRPDDFFLRESVAPAILRLEGIKSLERFFQACHLGKTEGHDNDALTIYVMEMVESEPYKGAICLTKLATSPDPEFRSDAAQLLALVHTHVDVEVLFRLSADSIAKVRASACGSLGAFRQDERVFGLLIQHLKDPAESVRLETARSLGNLGDIRALPVLKKLRDQASTRHHVELYEEAVGKIEQENPGFTEDRKSTFPSLLIRLFGRMGRD